jgi:hypothetical protein
LIGLKIQIKTAKDRRSQRKNEKTNGKKVRGRIKHPQKNPEAGLRVSEQL